MNAISDMSQVIIPRSDQINADTLMAGPMTVTVRDVKIQGGQEQPVTILLEETDLFYRPCKSMSRVLVAAWGPDANKYVGRSLTLYRDAKVKWGGMEVGGIRISHMTDIDRDMVMALTATKGRRDPFKVQPMEAPAAAAPKADKAKAGAQALVDRILAAGSTEAVDAILAEPIVIKDRAWSAKNRPELAAMIDNAITTARDDTGFSDQPSDTARAPADAAADAPQPSAEPSEAADSFREGRADSDMGEQPAPLDRALLLVAVAASPAECSEICDDYIAQLSDEEYGTLSKAANERAKTLMGVK